MKTQEQIVLRIKRGSRSLQPLLQPGLKGLDMDSGAAVNELVVERADLLPSETSDLRRDPDVLCAAHPMPLTLIEPLAGDAAAAPAGPSNAWGIEAVGAHLSPWSGQGVKVAVLDTGINPNHVAFQGVKLIRKNFTQGPDDDVNGHGTHCAGTIFGRDVDGVRIGIARGVTEALIGKVLGPGAGSSATLASAMTWAYENGATVISMSLGIDFPGFVEQLVASDVPLQAATSIALQEYRNNVELFSALTKFLTQSAAFAQSAVVVAASGNESERPKYVVGAAPPAAGDGMIAVGALGRLPGGGFGVASFSNTQCDLSGPGVDVTSAWIGGDRARKIISGTSMATPHVAGCAALWAEHLASKLGVVKTEDLSAQLVATAAFPPGAARADIGRGMVQAPRNL